MAVISANDAKMLLEGLVQRRVRVFVESAGIRGYVDGKLVELGDTTFVVAHARSVFTVDFAAATFASAWGAQAKEPAGVKAPKAARFESALTIRLPGEVTLTVFELRRAGRKT